MKPLLSVSLVALFAGAVVAQEPDLTIEIVPHAVEFRITGPEQPFFAAVLVSLSPALEPYAAGLPPLLTDFAVLGLAYGDSDAGALYVQAEQTVPPGILFFAQGVTLDAVKGFQATPVRDFVLDVTVPGE